MELVKKVSLALSSSDFEKLQNFHITFMPNALISLGAGTAKEPVFYFLLFL